MASRAVGDKVVGRDHSSFYNDDDELAVMCLMLERRSENAVEQIESSSNDEVEIATTD